MKWLGRITLLSSVFILTVTMAHWWFGSAYSERLGSWINRMLADGSYPHIASDIETVLVVAIATGVSVAAVAGVRWVFGKMGRSGRD